MPAHGALKNKGWVMLDIKPVRTLLGKTFVIPPFQRGYRWGEENVRLFLDDLFEYRKRGKGFYLDEENEEAREDYGGRFGVREGKVTDKKREFKFARDVLLDLDDQDRVETALAFLNAFAEAVENE